MNDTTDPPATALIAIGVDGAPAGWVAACLHVDAMRPEDARLWETRLDLCANIDQLALLREDAGGSATLAIDVPIGLPPAASYRSCDLKARELLKQVGRASSVFA